MGDCVMRLPLTGRRGEVRGYALVDAEDYEWLREWRWHLDNAGYARRSEYLGKIDGKYRHNAILLHRVLLGLPTPGREPQGDHINRDRLDNRKSNLRVATHSENMQNRKITTTTTTGYRGVTEVRAGNSRRRTTKYVARCNNVYLGVFDTPELAARAAAHARKVMLPFSEEAA